MSIFRWIMHGFLLAIGSLFLIGGGQCYAEAAREPLVIDLEATTLEGLKVVPGRNVLVTNATCVLSEVTYIPDLGGETGSPDCFYPVVSRSQWHELVSAHTGTEPFPTPDYRRVRLIFKPSCIELQREHGSYVGPRKIPPESCEARGQLLAWGGLHDSYRRHLESQYPLVTSGLALDPALERGEGGAIFVLVIGLVLVSTAIGLTYVALKSQTQSV